MEWPFDQAQNVAAITTRGVLDGSLPIRVVQHIADDHSWAFLCGTSGASEDRRIIGMGEALALDETLRSIADLPPGWMAYRRAVGDEWTRLPHSVETENVDDAEEERGDGQTIGTAGNTVRIWSPSEILRRYAGGEREFHGLEIASDAESSMQEFRRADLEGAAFVGCFICADFTGACLRNVKFASNVKSSCFDQADLRGATFSGSVIDGATFLDANMDGANFEGAFESGYTYAKDELPIRRRT